MISCVWDTVENWAILSAQDESMFLAFQYQAGDTYFRVCNGVVWMNETMFQAIVMVPP